MSNNSFSDKLQVLCYIDSCNCHSFGAAQDGSEGPPEESLLLGIGRDFTIGFFQPH